MRGELEIPFQMGTFGGALKSNELYKIGLSILKVENTQELGMVAACLGLAQNFSALKALVSLGIQKGHMKLHARNIALSAGVPVSIVDKAV